MMYHMLVTCTSDRCVPRQAKGHTADGHRRCGHAATEVRGNISENPAFWGIFGMQHGRKNCVLLVVYQYSTIKDIV